MMKGLIVVVGAALLTTQLGYAQGGSADPAKQAKAGESLLLCEGVTLRVVKSPSPRFKSVKLKGEAVVVALNFDAGKQNATLFYKATGNVNLSEVYLTDGTNKIAPRAVVEDFPSWGKDNDQEVEILDSKDKSGSETLTFSRAGSVFLLFDVPTERARGTQRVAITVRALKPADEQHSFVVSL